MNSKIDQSNASQNNISIAQLQQKQPQDQQGAPISTEIKYKEIILDNNIDLTQQDYDYIKNNMRMGGVVIIKNAHLLGFLFTELINDMLQMKPDDFSPNFKFILICNIDEVMKNINLYEQCRIINDNLIYEDDCSRNNKIKFRSVKDHILSLISKIPMQVYTFLLNTPMQYLRLFLRKVIYSYIIIFGVLQATELKNPFTYNRKDLYALCKFLVTYIEGENFTEDKYKNDFINAENSTGFNYMTLILVINTIFIYTKQIDKNDECKINQLVSEVFNFKVFMSPEFYIDIGNIKINIKKNHDDLTFEDIYKTFDHFFSDEFESLVPNQSVVEQKEKQEKYTDNIFNNVISVIDYNHEIENVNKYMKEIDYSKIYLMLMKFREMIPTNIQYIHEEDAINLENKENEINSSLFKKNKYGLYFNPIDESLLYEIISFNKGLEFMHRELGLIIGMLEGSCSYDNYHLNVLEILNKGKVPKELNMFSDTKHFNKNIKFSIYKEVLQNRISIFKKWLSDGSMKYYHLPLFSNINLFMYSIKMHFCRKYYGENDYAKITPEMMSLKFISTKYPTYEDLISNDRDLTYYNTVYHNEIIWVDGLVLNNATIDPTNKHLLFSNLQNNIKQKLNLVGITYTIPHNENEDSESNENEEEQEEEEESQSKKSEEEESGNESKTESKKNEEEKENDKDEEKKKEENKEDKKEENKEDEKKENKDENKEDKKEENKEDEKKENKDENKGDKKEENKEDEKKENKEENKDKKKDDDNADEKEQEKKDKDENNKEEFENQNVKIYIYGNKNDLLSNKYYKEEPFGFFEFRMFNSDLNGQNYIFEHDIKVTVEDYDDFVKDK